MKTILLHGLGQNAHDWEGVTSLISNADCECPDLFPATDNSFSYSEIMHSLDNLDKKRIRAICEPEVKDTETGETWLDYYNTQIQELRDRLQELQEG